MKRPPEIYYDFMNRIKANGERFPKKHGEWYRVKVLNRWITLDTWNGRIALHGKKCDPSGDDAWGNLVCFHTDETTTLAINFGHYEEHPELNYWRLHLKKVS